MARPFPQQYPSPFNQGPSPFAPDPNADPTHGQTQTTTFELPGHEIDQAHGPREWVTPPAEPLSPEQRQRDRHEFKQLMDRIDVQTRQISHTTEALGRQFKAMGMQFDPSQIKQIHDMNQQRDASVAEVRGLFQRGDAEELSDALINHVSAAFNSRDQIQGRHNTTGADQRRTHSERRGAEITASDSARARQGEAHTHSNFPGGNFRKMPGETDADFAHRKHLSEERRKAFNRRAKNDAKDVGVATTSAILADIAKSHANRESTEFGDYDVVVQKLSEVLLQDRDGRIAETRRLAAKAYRTIDQWDLQEPLAGNDQLERDIRNQLRGVSSSIEGFSLHDTERARSVGGLNRGRYRFLQREINRQQARTDHEKPPVIDARFTPDGGILVGLGRSPKGEEYSTVDQTILYPDGSTARLERGRNPYAPMVYIRRNDRGEMLPPNRPQLPASEFRGVEADELPDHDRVLHEWEGLRTDRNASVLHDVLTTTVAETGAREDQESASMTNLEARIRKEQEDQAARHTDDRFVAQSRERVRDLQHEYGLAENERRTLRTEINRDTYIDLYLQVGRPGNNYEMRPDGGIIVQDGVVNRSPGNWVILPDGSTERVIERNGNRFRLFHNPAGVVVHEVQI